MWHDKLFDDGTYDDGHRDMCRHGIRKVRRGEYDALEFRVFSYHEHEPIRAIMKELAPEIQYRFNTVFPERPQGPA